LDLEVPEVLPPEPLGHLHRLAAGVPAVVEPALVIEPERLDDEGVAVPAADRVAEPRRLTLFGEVAAVGEDLTEVGEVLEENHREARGLYDLPGIVGDQH